MLPGLSAAVKAGLTRFQKTKVTMRTDAKREQKRAGFSMIEVLVASTMLVVIVMMLAMLFQQTSVAWRTGQIRAQGAMRLRSYIGAIQRDASAAFDAKNLPKQLLYNNEKQSFRSDEIRFYTLNGDSYTFSKNTPNLKRSLCFITYDVKGTRTKCELSESGWGAPETTSVLDFLSGASTDEKNAVSPQNFSFQPVLDSGTEYDKYGQSVPAVNRFPLYMTVDAQFVQKGKLYDVGAESAGPDGTWDTKDDIRTWVK